MPKTVFYLTRQIPAGQGCAKRPQIVLGRKLTFHESRTSHDVGSEAVDSHSFFAGVRSDLAKTFFLKVSEKVGPRMCSP